MRIAIVADDLTGAADCALQCRLAGLSARVVLEPAPAGAAVAQAAASDADSRAVAVPAAAQAAASDVDSRTFAVPAVAQATAFDTDTRALAPDLAAERVARLGKALRAEPWDVIYKKIDSTLRGNIGAELGALADAFDPDLVVIAPAFPAAGRQVVEGRVLVDGRPLHLTDAGRDPSSPVRTSSVVERLAEQLGRQEGPRRGAQLGEPIGFGAPGPDEPAEAIGRRLIELSRAGRRAVVCDAASDADLAAIVRGVRASALRVIWLGSAGLMAQLVSNRSEPAADWPTDMGGGRVLVVAGSLHTRTRLQLARLCEVPEVGCVDVEAAALVDPAGRAPAVATALAQVEQVSGGARHLVLVTRSEPGAVERVQAEAERLGMSHAAVGGPIAAGLAEIAGETAAAHGFARLVLTGGDIARAVCNRLGMTTLDIEGALEAGIPLSRGLRGAGGDNRPQWLVTKAGGFGGDDALVRAVRRLSGET